MFSAVVYRTYAKLSATSSQWLPRTCEHSRSTCSIDNNRKPETSKYLYNEVLNPRTLSFKVLKPRKLVVKGLWDSGMFRVLNGKPTLSPSFWYIFEPSHRMLKTMKPCGFVTRSSSDMVEFSSAQGRSLKGVRVPLKGVQFPSGRIQDTRQIFN